MSVTAEMFRSRVSRSVLTEVEPPASLEDMSRWRDVGTFTNITRTGLPSGISSLDFAGNSFIEVPAADSTQVNFTSESFSVLVWVKIELAGHAMRIVGQDSTDIDGWTFFIWINTLSFRLNQGGGHTDISAVNGVAESRWQLVGVTRAGNTGQFYNNGQAIATIGGGGLVDAVSVAGGRKLLFGINNNEVSDGFHGSQWKPRIIGESYSPAKMWRVYEEERGYFGL